MSSPNWFNGKSINEGEFRAEFILNRPLKCIGGKLYDIDGEVSDSEIRFSTHIKTDNREVRGYKGIRSRFRNIILQ